jgi:hypothetical protein
VDDLVTYLNTLLTGIFKFSYNIRTLKITITSTTSTPFRLVSTNNNNNIYEVLGFEDYITYTTLATSYVAPYLFNMIGVQVLHICVTNLNLQSIGLKNKSKYNIIDSVQVLVNSGETQTYFNDNNFVYKVTENAITNIAISIFDQDMNTVNFNNIDWYINLTVNFAYQKVFIPSDYLANTFETGAKLALLQQEARNLLNNDNNDNI